MKDHNTNDVALLNEGRRQTIQTEYNGVPAFIVPNDMKLLTLAGLVEAQLDRPYQLSQHVTVLSEQSFVDYVQRYATLASTVFADTEAGIFRCILDYHDSPTEPGHKFHKVDYRCPKTPEWCDWIKYNNQKMSQEEFALFIEENAKEITEPNASDMLAIATTLKAKKDVEFKSSKRIDNGQTQFIYNETINGQAGISGELHIPEKIKLAIVPFHSGAAYELEARFRYRISPQGLTIWYTLIKPHRIYQHAVKEVLEKIKEGIKHVHVIEAETDA